MTFPKRILGIDYGTKRIGIAVSDPLNITAQGVKVVLNTLHAIDEICRLAEHYDVETIVVGMPLTLKGTKGAKAEEVEAFIERLHTSTGRTVVSWDERFSTRSAHATLLTMGVKKKDRRSKERIDIMASALILQGYLDSRKR